MARSNIRGDTLALSPFSTSSSRSQTFETSESRVRLDASKNRRELHRSEWWVASSTSTSTSAGGDSVGKTVGLDGLTRGNVNATTTPGSDNTMINAYDAQSANQLADEAFDSNFEA